MAQVVPVTVPLKGGLDVVSSPLFAAPGSCRVAYNYEPATGGGYERVGGIEYHDGQPEPHLAEYLLLECEEDLAGVNPGYTVNGQTSTAEAVCIYVSGNQIGLTKVDGTFEVEENLRVGTDVVGVIASLDVSVDGVLDNQLYALAASAYRLDITKVPGFGRVRGLAVVQDALYAWCNNSDTTAMQIHKATDTGWQLVPLYWQISFTAGTSEYEDGDTLSQTPTTATIKRVVVESGSWATNDAAGRFIITQETGGTFSGGAAVGGGACTLVGTASRITLEENGNVRTDLASFVGSAADQRLYGCDGVNPEFEFADDVLVPLNTGMPIRATTVRAHRNHLFFGFNGSLQHSGIGDPYKWTVLSGATELGAGDAITDLVSIGGSEANAALMVLCRNSVLVLYGDDSETWSLKPLSRKSGCSAGSAQDIAGVVALDAPGFVRYPATQAFGNFLWDSISTQIEPIAKGQDVECSVFIPQDGKYRVFFKDATAVCGVPVDKGRFEWTTIDYGLTITACVHAEINGVARTFYGDLNGWVYEADVGRSFAGLTIPWALKLNELNQKTPSIIKQYRRCEIEVQPQSAFTMHVQAEFADENDPIDPTAPETVLQRGNGLFYELKNWDAAYWDVAEFSRRRFPLEGLGTSIAVTIAGESDNELPHTVKAITTYHTPRRMAR